MIQFCCKNCGHKFSVPQASVGKKARCPKCKNIVVAPEVGDTNLIELQADTSEISSKDSILNPNLFDIPQKSKEVGQGDVPDKALENLRKLKSDEVEPAPPPKHQLPWLIDIFLYPVSKPGLTILGIVVGIPLLFNIIVKVLGKAAMVFPPMLILLTLFASISFIVDAVLAVYMYWYFCECIRDSAAGWLRAPETMSITPSLGEMLWQMIRMLVCFIIFVGPSLVYLLNTRNPDALFWVLLAYGVFFFPMGLLAVVMFDSFSALNPLLLIGSIFSTFFQYCGLLLLFCGLGVLSVIIMLILRQSRISSLLFYVLHIFFIYLLMVASHLLGRFYWKYLEKLNWEV